MRRVLLYLRPYRKWMALAWLFMLTELTIELWQPLLMGKIIDDGVMKRDVTAILRGAPSCLALRCWRLSPALPIRLPLLTLGRSTALCCAQRYLPKSSHFR